MKKLSLALAGVLFAGSLVAFTACDGDGGSVGKVNGNFKQEATAQEVQTALSQIDFDTAFSAIETSGIQMLGEFNVSVKEEDSSSQVAFTFEMNQGKTAGEAASTGKFDLSTKQTVDGVSTSTKANAKIYQDSSYLYFDAKMDDSALKAKVSVEELLELIMENIEPEEPDFGDGDIDGEIPDTDGDGEDEEGREDIEIMNPDALLQAVLDAGFKTYLDQTNGLKIKFGGDSELIAEAFAQMEIPVEASALQGSAFDVYFAFDANGAFSQAGIDLNIKLTVEGETAAIKGGFAIKPYSGAITLPAGIANDISYFEIPLRTIIGGIGGGSGSPIF